MRSRISGPKRAWFEVRARRAIWFPVSLLFCFCILNSSIAVALDPNNVSQDYITRLCDVNSARFIIIRFTDESGLVVGKDGIQPDPRMKRASGLSAVDDLLTWRGQTIEIRRLMSRSLEDVSEHRQRLAAKTGASIPNLNAYGILRVPGDTPLTGEALQELLEKLNDHPQVAIAYPRPYYTPATDSRTGKDRPGLYTPPDATPNFDTLQTYRYGRADNGFNAERVYTWSGSQGENVKVVDIEGDWIWTHEDLPAPFDTIGTYYGPPDDSTYRHHGTAVVGIIAAQDNGYGVTGFVPNAKVGGVVSEVAWDDSTNWYDASAAICAAASLLDSGDVYLIELQASKVWPPSGPLFPVEYFLANFDAIRWATLSGIVCVEAAGNSGLNLDPYFPDFVRNDPELDCGAIMVGGYDYDGGSVPSNNGERVDVHGWYTGVATTGYGGLFGRADSLSEDRYYLSDFGGTSAASAIVAGVAASIQSIYIAEEGPPMTPWELRQLMRDSGHYIEGASDVIGPRPDIAEAIRFLYDTGPPEAVTDLAESEVKSNWISVQWTAPADDFRGMQVDSYDLRYSESPIDESNFEFAAQVPDVMDPGEPGSDQLAKVEDLSPSTTYYFAIKSTDPGGRVSPISNVIPVTTDDPAPEITVDVTVVEFGTTYLSNTLTSDLTVRNTGTADLVIQNCLVFHDPDVSFGCISYPVTPIAPGASGFIQMEGTPFIAAHLGGYIEIRSNDPDTPALHVGLGIDGADLDFSAETIFAVPDGQATGTLQIDNPSMVPVTFSLKPDIALDFSHGQNENVYQNITLLLDNHAYNPVYLYEITAASLAGFEALHINGSDLSWTAAEYQAVADWVQAGGGLYVGCTLDSEVDTALDPLLDALGLGTPLAYDPVVPVGSTNQLSGDFLLNGVTAIVLMNPFYKLDSIPDGAAWLFRTQDGSIEKAFRADVGAGRVVVVADNVYQNPPVPAGNERFLLNAFKWLAGRPSWLEFQTSGGSVEAQSTAELPISADATGLAIGTYSCTARGKYLGTQKVFDVVLEVVEAEISNRETEFTDRNNTTHRWNTNVSLPCRFRYRVSGTSTWSSPVLTPAGFSHEVMVATQPNTEYEGWIEALSGGDPVAEDLFTFKTPRHYSEPIPVQEHLPKVTRLAGASPNPFNPNTMIRFELAANEHVHMEIYDVTGRVVRNLLDERRAPGYHAVLWDGRDNRGQRVSSGVYFLRMRGDSYRGVSKLVLLK